MEFFKRYFRPTLSSIVASLVCLLLILTAAPLAYAQVAPGSSVFSYAGQRLTYRASLKAFTPANSATDFLVIQGSATRPVRVLRIWCNGISTANATYLLQAIKRSAADTGTLTAMTAVPLNSQSGLAATATVGSYAANPSVLGTAVGTVDIQELLTNTAATSSVENNTAMFDFSNQNLILNGAAETLALNGNGASPTAGFAANCTVEWSES